MSHVYTVHPIGTHGVVIPGRAVASSGSAAGLQAARERCLELNPHAAGTAHAWAGNVVELGDRAGHELNVGYNRKGEVDYFGY